MDMEELLAKLSDFFRTVMDKLIVFFENFGLKIDLGDIFGDN